jgi:hypothetical protein
MLRKWVAGAAWSRSSHVDRLMLRFDLVTSKQRVQEYSRDYADYRAKVAAAPKREIANTTGRIVLPAASTPLPPTRPELLSLAYDTLDDLLLDIVDGLLDLLPFLPPAQVEVDPVARLLKGVRRMFQGTDVRKPLQQHLDDARSVYTIREDGRGLERRINIAAMAAGAQAMTTAEQAGCPVAAARLRAAWSKVGALHPDPGGAYADAVRAVEAVANPMFLPADPEPTLGKVHSHLSQAAHKYELVIADRSGLPASIETAVSMIGTLWHGHRDRHEGGPTNVPINQAAAEAAVVLATALVQLLLTGTVQRKP